MVIQTGVDNLVVESLADGEKPPAKLKTPLQILGLDISKGERETTRRNFTCLCEIAIVYIDLIYFFWSVKCTVSNGSVYVSNLIIAGSLLVYDGAQADIYKVRNMP